RQGLSEAQLDAMPRFQVVGLDAWRRYRVAYEEYIAWTTVPHYGREPGYRKAGDKVREAGAYLERTVFFGGGLTRVLELTTPPAFEKVDNAVHRVDRRFAALRCVEAIRLYMATHDGKLPASLKDITEVPIPVDPLTELPFEYELKGDTARLSAPP